MNGFGYRWICLSLPSVLYAGSPLVADWWLDPFFEEMLERADLIAVVEVTQGGDFTCLAKPLDILKGTRPAGLLRVSGYNNGNWPEKGIRAESLAKDDRLLMFISRVEVEPEEEPDGRDGARGETIWFTPTPSTGDYRIIDGRIHGGWIRNSYPHSTPGVDVALVLTLVRGALERRAGTEPEAARARIATELTVELVKSVEGEDGDERDREARERAQTLQWLLCAQADYGDAGPAAAVLQAAGSPNTLVKLCAARALLSLQGSEEEVLTKLRELLLFPGSLVQAEAARTLVAGTLRSSGAFRRDRAVKLLLEALPKSSPEDGGPMRLMDPVRNVFASGREVMVAGLTRLGAEEAGSELLELLEPREMTEGVFRTLCDHFVKFPSDAARSRILALYDAAPQDALPAFHRYLLRERSAESIGALVRKLREGRLAPLEFDDVLGELARTAPDSDVVKGLVLDFLEKYGTSDDAVSVLPAAIPLASEEIRELLDAYAEEKLDEDTEDVLEIVRRAVELKLNAPPDAAERVRAWTALVRKEVHLGFASRHLLHELIRATPPALRGEAAASLRKIYDMCELPKYLEGIATLGGPLSPEEKRILEALRSR